MKKTPVIAVFDIGKTNKKLFLFDENYKIVFERSARLTEVEDEDGYPCEDVDSLRLSVFDALHQVFRDVRFEIKAVNFSAYGASLVFLNERGFPLTPLYNYLKPYPSDLSNSLYQHYAGEESFCLQTASPSLGSLNSGLQLYRLSKERPELFKELKVALHLPQYMSYLLTGQLYSDMTSIGCHTALWDYREQQYHEWVEKEGLNDKLAPIKDGGNVLAPIFPNSTFVVGIGLHDSSAALIPYLLSFREPFVLISTGTWSISMNPFNASDLTKEELQNDTLFYLSYRGVPVKAARVFLGNEHSVQCKRIADFFKVESDFFESLKLDRACLLRMQEDVALQKLRFGEFETLDLDVFVSAAAAYYALNIYLVNVQIESLNLILQKEQLAKRVFVDGGFSKNYIFMQLLADKLNLLGIELFAASVAQATALGAALAIHEQWNSKPIPENLIELKGYKAL